MSKMKVLTLALLLTIAMTGFALSQEAEETAAEASADTAAEAAADTAAEAVADTAAEAVADTAADTATEAVAATVVDVVFGTDVDRETRTLVGEASTFGTDLERVWCLTRVQGLTPPANITHAWYYEGKTMARVDLKVGSPDWRTWSSKRYLPAWTGQWEVKVLDEAGKVLASGSFEVEQDIQ